MSRAGRWALVAMLGSLVSSCSPYQLVLRPSPIDWDRLGISSVAVVPLQEGSASASASLALPKLTADAAQLLSFALNASALGIVKPGPETARLEVGVTGVAFESSGSTESSGSADSSSSAEPPAPAGDDASMLRGSHAFGTLVDDVPSGDRAIRATLVVSLLAPDRAKPLWTRTTYGVVPFHKSEELFQSAAASGSDGLDAEDLALLQELAMRRALRKVLAELVPRYQYQELR